MNRRAHAVTRASVLACAIAIGGIFVMSGPACTSQRNDHVESTSQALTPALVRVPGKSTLHVTKPSPSSPNGPLSPSDYSVLTEQVNSQRTGQQPNESTLDPPTVQTLTLWSTRTFPSRFLGIPPPEISAQPLVTSGVNIGGYTQDAVIIETRDACWYAFSRDLSIQYNSECYATVSGGTGSINTSISTPVIEKGSNSYLYFVIGLWDDSTNTNFHYWLMKERLTDLTIMWSVQISDSHYAGMPFTAYTTCIKQFQRPALLLDNSTIYLAFGAAPGVGCGENTDYHGWLFAYNSSDGSSRGSPYLTSRQNTDTTVGMAGIWQWGVGPAADGNNKVYVATGNGRQDANNDGNQYSQLNGGSSWSGTTSAYWRDPSSAFLANFDLDLGSTGPVILPGPTPRMLGAGKQALFRVLDTSTMGEVSPSGFRAGFNQYYTPLDQTNCGTMICNNVVTPCTAAVPVLPNTMQTICCRESAGGSAGCAAHCFQSGFTPNTGPCNYQTTWANVGYVITGSHPHIHGSPVYWNGTVYWWAEKDFPRYLAWDSTNGKFSSTPTDTGSRLSTDTNDRAPGPPTNDPGTAMPGGRLFVSANGTSNGVIWGLVAMDANVTGETCDISGGTTGHMWLKAFDPTRAGTSIARLVQLDVGCDARHTLPTVAGGLVYVANYGCGAPNCGDTGCATPGKCAQLRAYGPGGG